MPAEQYLQSNMLFISRLCNKFGHWNHLCVKQGHVDAYQSECTLQMHV